MSESESRNQFQGIDDFVARSARDAVVAAAMMDALHALQLIQLAEVEVGGQAGMLDFSIEIEKLKAALHLVGVEDAAG